MAGLNDAARAAEVPFRCYGLAPMSAMAFDATTPELASLIWTYFLQEAAQRGVLFRRGGLNFVVYTHTDEDVDRAVAAAGEALVQLRRHLDAGTLAEAVKATAPEAAFRRF